MDLNKLKALTPAGFMAIGEYIAFRVHESHKGLERALTTDEVLRTQGALAELRKLEQIFDHLKKD